MMQNKTVSESIYDFRNNKQKLDAAEDDDPSDQEVDKIYREISQNAKRRKRGSVEPLLYD
jgi:hypothetical protein